MVKVSSHARLSLTQSLSSSFADVRIYAQDGQYHVQLPAVLMAMHSQFLKKLLLTTPLNGPFYCILSDLDQTEVDILVQFMTRGILPVNLSEQTEKFFLSLGISICMLRLKKVKVDLPKEPTAAHATEDKSVVFIDPAADAEDPVEATIEHGIPSPSHSVDPAGHDDMEYVDEEAAEDDLDDPDVFKEAASLDEQEEEETALPTQMDVDDQAAPSQLRTRQPDETFTNQEAEHWVKMIRECPWNDYPPKPVKPNPKPVSKTCTFCTDCGFKTHKGKIFDQHRLHHKIKGLDRTKYHCSIFQCLKQFESESEWAKHGKTVHHGKIYQCYDCNKTFTGVSTRTAHMQLSHKLSEEDRKSVKEICVHCGSKFTRIEAYKKHRKYESTYHNNKCPHIGCEQEFKSWPEHKTHLELVHNNVRAFICGICPQVFHNKGDKIKHRLTEHPSKLSMFLKQCDLCGKHTNALARHLALEHKQDIPGYCVECAQEVPNYRNHWATEHTEPWTKKDPEKSESRLCMKCGKEFSSVAGLKIHVSTQHKGDNG